jgi:hypothetical protein
MHKTILMMAALAAMCNANATLKDELVGKDGVPVTLQRVITHVRPAGPVYIAIPLAHLFGKSNGRDKHYCSPSIRASNSSNEVVEELIIGIDYRNGAGQVVSSSITRYDNIKIQAQDTHIFYQLETHTCTNLTGSVSVLRCKYSSGHDCSKDVVAIDFGAIPLTLKRP